jgi:hypothetical protein
VLLRLRNLIQTGALEIVKKPKISDDGKEGSARGTQEGFPSPIQSKASRTFSKFWKLFSAGRKHVFAPLRRYQISDTVFF